MSTATCCAFTEPSAKVKFQQGWTNPAIGAYKAGVVNSAKGEDGYNAATDNGGALMSEQLFEGKDKDGKKAAFKIHISAAPGVETLYVIKQLLMAPSSA